MTPSIKAAITIAGMLASVLIAVSYFTSALPVACGNKPLAEAVSPDGTRKLVVFERDCGGTTGFSTQASVLAPHATLANEAGNIFAADTGHGAAPAGAGGGPELRVAWTSPNHLRLQHHESARLFKAERQFEGIEISYETFK
jgi:hypothetical protein